MPRAPRRSKSAHRGGLKSGGGGGAWRAHRAALARPSSLAPRLLARSLVIARSEFALVIALRAELARSSSRSHAGPFHAEHAERAHIDDPKLSLA
jgi:hypothetical protein